MRKLSKSQFPWIVILSAFPFVNAISRAAFDDLLHAAGGTWGSRPTTNIPSEAAISHQDPSPDAGYVVTQVRTNEGKPFIDSHRYHGKFDYNFNLVPAFVTLPDQYLQREETKQDHQTRAGQLVGGLIVRSANGTGYQAENGTASTLMNPDRLTWTKLWISSESVENSDAAHLSLETERIGKESVIMEPINNTTEACGLQDPRIVGPDKGGSYYMTFCVLSDPLPKDPKTNPLGILCGNAGVGIATTKTPWDAKSWVRQGYNCDGACGKSAAILIRDEGPHYMFWGIPNISIAVSDDLIHWKPWKTNWAVPKPEWDEMWIEAGAPPRMLRDGNYLFNYNIAYSNLWWGIGYFILDGKDPSMVVQRGTKVLYPELDWEKADTPDTDWEPYKNCIGAMNSLMPFDGAIGGRYGAGRDSGGGTIDKFLGFYVAGDAVSAATMITVEKKADAASKRIANDQEILYN